MMLKDILTKEQEGAGLTLNCDEDFVYLYYGERVLATWSTQGASQVMIRVKNLHGIPCRNISCLEHLWAFDFDPNGLWAFGVKFQPHLFKIEDNFCHILFDSWDR